MFSRHSGRPGGRTAAVGLCVGLVLALGSIGAPVAMSAAVNEGNAFGELTEGSHQETTPTPTTTATTGAESGYGGSKSLLYIVGGAAVVLLIGIAYVIVRDARRVAPAGDGQLTEGNSAHDATVRLRRRRAKAKAARRQRKRNRAAARSR